MRRFALAPVAGKPSRGAPATVMRGFSYRCLDCRQPAAWMRFAFARLKIVIEPSGAVPLAALLTGAVPAAGRTGVVLSGGNIAPADFAALVG